MKTLLFDVFPANGHYSAILKTAKILCNHGFHAIITGSPEFRERVQRQGLEYLHLNPFLLIPEKSIKEQDKGWSPFQKRGSYRSKRISEWNENFSGWKKIILAVNPSLVILDEQNAIKAGAYRILGIPVLFFQTKPDTRKIKAIPPFTFYFIPRFNPVSNWICSGLWLFKGIKPYSQLCLRKLNLLKANDLYIYLYIYKSLGIKLNDQIDLKRSFGLGIKGFSRLVVSPAPIDFPHDEHPNIHRIGPLVDINREGKIDHPRYNALLTNIEELKSKGKGMIIYSSMGTISRFDMKRCTRFFLRFSQVARINPEHLFVISTGSYFDINLLFPKPDNVMIFESVPQVDLLQKCDIMVTHGGMNSITECVFCGVPMLVYPLSRKWDQPGNSARVVYHQLGLRGRIERDSAKTISKKINQLIGNYQYYKDNVLKMRNQFELKNQSTEVVSIIESIINSHEN